MAIKKSELYSSLWAGADDLRGGMDASQYKVYVLSLFFLKHISVKTDSDTWYIKMRLCEKLGNSYLRMNGIV
jgi:type I restriction enzyme M protein